MRRWIFAVILVVGIGACGDDPNDVLRSAYTSFERARQEYVLERCACGDDGDDGDEGCKPPTVPPRPQIDCASAVLRIDEAVTRQWLECMHRVAAGGIACYRAAEDCAGNDCEDLVERNAKRCGELPSGIEAALMACSQEPSNDGSLPDLEPVAATAGRGPVAGAGGGSGIACGTKTCPKPKTLFETFPRAKPFEPCCAEGVCGTRTTTSSACIPTPEPDGLCPEWTDDSGDAHPGCCDSKVNECGFDGAPFGMECVSASTLSTLLMVTLPNKTLLPPPQMCAGTPAR